MVSHTILIVDDEANQRMLLATALASLARSWQIIHASSGAEAIAATAQVRISLVITDYQMPAMSGLDLVAALRSRNCQAPVILISAYNLEEVRLRAAALAIEHLLEKPFPLDTIRRLTISALAPTA